MMKSNYFERRKREKKNCLARGKLLDKMADVQCSHDLPRELLLLVASRYYTRCII